MIINSIELEGFMRFKDPTKVEFKDGIGVIYGNNGSGKTSIFDAICIALYGKSYRTSGNSENGFLNIGDLVNRITNKAKIRLNFSAYNKDYTIEKNIHKNGKTSTYLIENGEQIAEGKHVNEIVINKLIGMDYTSFKNSLFIAQNEAMSLLETTGSERKNILKTLLKLDIYDLLLEVSNDVKREYEDKKMKLDGELNILKASISDEEQLRSEIKEAENEIIKLKEEMRNKQELVLLNNEIERLEKEIDETNKEYAEVNGRIEVLKNDNIRLTTEIKDLEDRLSKVYGATVCPYCLSPISNPEHLYNHYETEISTRKNKINENNIELNKLNENLAKINTKMQELKESLMAKMNEKTAEEEGYSNRITALKTKINENKKDLLKIEKNKKEIAEKENEIKHIEDKLMAIEILKEAYRETPNMIMRRITPFIEKEAGEIVNFISDGTIEDILIDRDTFKIKPVVNGVAEELQFLSGGERLRVGIALRLAISKMMVMASTTKTTVKNLFIDEGDFGALDENGINDIASLFTKLKEKFSKIILITHIEDLKNKVADYTYNVIKTGNYVSSVIENSV